MQLDRTRIAIRPRGIWDVMDLALRVVRADAIPLLLSVGVGAMPLAVWNGFRLHWMLADEYTAQSIGRYLFVMSELIFLESPLATLGTTVYLGRVMFLQPASARSIVADVRQLLHRILWTQLWRGSLVALVLLILLSPTPEVSPIEFVLPIVCGLAAMVRAPRPFLNEIALLERNPLRSADPNTMTIGRRSRALHAPISTDLAARWLVVAVAGVVLTLCGALTCWFATGVLTGVWRWGPLMVQGLVPLSMWLVTLYMAVVRFLHYIDLRIRREGWEVELTVRAAATELEAQRT